MLEIRNITKIYRSKTGEEVKALDNVSIQFPENGMVFILGKSGSGKSTLLNVMGGLDSYDSGEFVIKGKSSKDFGGSDFDAYRNTFIGFIFQEYNVLDDFTVGANIGLALELQGKKATDKAVNGILAQVDLLNYAKRKPNELSGGQKQRVAIARALVKEPEIIMADEPTGALDSNTGKQIFDTLKELSKTKLVLIVSHDRDFAERYADRIVELADGKIIEDVTKHEHKAEQISEGVHRINDNILRIESGYKLTAKDLEMINAYLAKNQGDVLLSGDNRVNEELRSAAGISKDGATTVFEGTVPERDVKTKQYEKGKTKFIRSRLPMKNAVKMGSSSLKHKKFRLFMTILLSFLAFAMFGLSSSMAAYNKYDAATSSILDSQIKSAAVSLRTRRIDHWLDTGDSYTGYDGAALNADDLAWLKENTDLDFVPVFTGYASSQYGEGGFNLSYMMGTYTQNTVYNARLSGFTTMTEEQRAVTGYQFSVGRLPQSSGEIAITEFMYRQFNEYGFVNEQHGESVEKGQLTLDDNETTGIIGKHITINQIGWQSLNSEMRPSFEIVGVIDTKFDYDRYQALLPVEDQASQMQQQDESGLLEMYLGNEVKYERDYGFHALGFAVESDIEAMTAFMATNTGFKEFGQYMDAGSKQLRLIVLREADIEGDQPDYLASMYRVATFDELANANVTFFESGKSTLAANEILISKDRYNNLLPQSGSVVLDEETFNALGIAIYGAEVWNHTAITSKFQYSYANRLQYAEKILLIKEKVALMSVAEMQQNFSADNVQAAEQEWITRWVEYDEYMSVLCNGDLLEQVNFDWQGMYVERVQIQSFVEELYGIVLPNYVNKSSVQSALGFLYSFYYGDNATDSGYTLERWNFGWVEDLYEYNDAVKNQVWNNAALEAEMLEDQYNGIKNSDWNTYNAEQKKETLISYYLNYYSDVKEDLQTYNSSQLDAMKTQAFLSVCAISPDTLLNRVYVELREIENNDENSGTVLDTPAYKIVGVFDMGNVQYGDPSGTVISAEIYEYYTTWREQNMEKGESNWYQEKADHEDGIWAFAIAAVNENDQEAIRKLVELSYSRTEDYDPELLFEMQNAVMYTLGSFNEMIEILAQVFVWVGLGLAVFSSFLLMNFISTSISYKKREIGILRAVGARSSDVFKIFFSEAFIIAFINFLLATAASVATVILLNNYMRSSGINITLLSFGPMQVAVMLGVSVFVSVLASFLPVYKIAHKKPVDAIKDR